MPSFGFCGPSYTAISPIIDDERAMNCYCEKSESAGAATPMALLRTPGRKKFAGFPEVSVPCVFTVNGRTFAAASHLYEITAGGVVTNLGSIGATPTRPTMMTANETQLVILNNGNLYVLTLATNVLVAVNMAQFNGPVLQFGFSDGYVIGMLENSHTFQVSNLEDATTWSGLDISTNSLFPDNYVSMICDHREAWFWGNKKATGYYNAGAGFPPFIPIQGAFMESGAGATFATVQADNSVFWLDQDERGFMVARRLNGYAGDRISTHATELAWQSYANPTDAVGWTYQDQGHTFWVIYFASANATWAYDISTGLWHERGFWVAASATYIADRAMSHTLNFGKHLVGDWGSGTVYELSRKYMTDDGAIIRGNRRTPTTSKENLWAYYRQIEFIVGTGLVPEFPLFEGDGVTPRPPQLMLRWSNDGGKTWSNWYYLSVGFMGEYEKRVIKRMLGRGRKRLWDVAWTDPYPFAFNDACLQAELAGA